jgi:hypothetical protein
MTELTIDGVTRTRQEWADLSGIPKKSLDRRLSQGWSNREAVFGRPRLRIRFDIFDLGVCEFVNELREWRGQRPLYPMASSS